MALCVIQIQDQVSFVNVEKVEIRDEKRIGIVCNIYLTFKILI